ncbi:hypothetical protein JD844_010618 [Phrynosoma platyrhinos]|uniref:Uncharacterized protein n=1 Tax=Phrynosoma platyrhinos TaxID=52577 RepID=A0ABQ7TH48_PHRPL|nr:hypothetical protein JD844_010618 [Phrynosoma platyrhinos]
MKVLDLGFLYLLLEVNEAIKYRKCELYDELMKHGLDGYDGIGIGHFLTGPKRKPFRDYCRHPMPEIVFWECKTE